MPKARLAAAALAAAAFTVLAAGPASACASDASDGVIWSTPDGWEVG